MSNKQGSNDFELSNITRLFDALRLVNQVMIREKSKESLFQEICRILVDDGGFLLAWVGLANPEDHAILPVAQAGDATGYVKKIKVYSDDKPEGQGPCGITFRTGEPYICNWQVEDRITQPWREEAAKAGLQSSATIPIRQRGEVVAVLCVYSGIPDYFHEREVSLLVETARDISFALDAFLAQEERRVALERLADSQARLLAVTNSLDAGLFISDLNGVFLDVNQTAAQMYGIETAGHFPKDVSSVLQGLTICTLEGVELPRTEWPMACVLRGEILHGRELRVAENATGNVRVFSYTGRIVTCEDGRQLAFLSVRDITEKKRSEEALRSSEARLRSAQRIARLGSWDWDFLSDRFVPSDETRVILELDASVPFFSFKQIIAMTHPLDAEQVNLYLDGAMAGMLHFDVEYRMILPSGKVISIQNVAEFVRDERGAPISLTGTILDVTERHELQAQLSQSRKMEAIGRFSGGIAHDFSNSLSVIGGFANLLLEEHFQEGGEGKAYVERILAAQQSAKALTGQLMAFSRKPVVAQKPLDLKSAVRALEETLEKLAGPDRNLIFEYPDSELICFATTGQIEQLLTNLVVNARDATSVGGSIHVETQQALPGVGPSLSSSAIGVNHYATLTVTDNGAGMDEATKDRIFEPFFTTKDVGIGTGLGLATVYSIAEQAGGGVTVESSPGRGASFTVYLPQSGKSEEC